MMAVVIEKLKRQRSPKENKDLNSKTTQNAYKTTKQYQDHNKVLKAKHILLLIT